MLLKVPGGRGPGAGVAGAEVDSLAVDLHVLSHSKALAAVRALMRARHLVDCLNVPGESLLLTERFAAGGTLVVLNLSVDGSHVDYHVVW